MPAKFALATVSLCLIGMTNTILAKQPQPHTAMPLNMVTAIKAQKWTADDRPYKNVEARMAKEFADGQSPQAILAECRNIAMAQPKNPVAQFGWICAERGAFLVSNPGGSLPYDLVETLAKHDPGNVHEYTRYRFCLTQEADRVLPYQNAEVVGARLLQYDPADHFARTSLIYMLCDTDHAQAAMPYALNWVKAEPSNAKAHSSLALVYQDRWFETKNKQYGRMAVQEYQQFLRTAAPSDGFRGLAQSAIKFLQKDIAKAG